MKNLEIRLVIDNLDILAAEVVIGKARVFSKVYGGNYSLDCTTGLEYWTDIFLVFTHAMVSLIDSH